MPNGLLQVTGTIELSQFWPNGESDADTTKVHVDVSGRDAFQFRASPNEPFAPTHVFDNATVVGKTRKPAIDKSGRITIRLQGIDAPELHYTPQADKPAKSQSTRQHAQYLQWNQKYRQHFGEAATVALAKFLKASRKNPLPCTVLTAVDAPDEVFDTYGRFIGDICVERGGAVVDVNHWLVENGWAIPAFYNSMKVSEIDAILALWKKASRTPLPKQFTTGFVAFDWGLVFRPRGPAKADAGSVMFPKIFRRQSAYEVNKRAQMATGTFASYLQKRADELHLLPDFRSQGAQAAAVHHLSDFVKQNKLQVNPWEMVFREKPSTIALPGGATPAW